MKDLELLAPARNADIGIAAIDCGADAVYIAGPAFGARQAAGNSVEDIAVLCRYAHRFGARVFVTVNTIVFDSELSEITELIGSIAGAGADALIVQDLAVVDIVRRLGLDIALHASTQCAIRTPAKAKFLESLGFSRLILERELSLEQIEAIRAAVACELEFFVHGALCVCYSGQCYLSEYLSGRSANRGACVQACRSLYDLEDESGRKLVRGKSLLSLKDYNLGGRLDDLVRCGVTSFKIEGRLKNESYVRNVVLDYSKALDMIVRKDPGMYRRASFGTVECGFKPSADRTFNRGYTELFLDGKRGDWACIDAAKGMGRRVGTVTGVNRRHTELQVSTKDKFSNGDGFSFVARDGRIIGFRADVATGNRIECKAVPELYLGAVMFRNFDAAFEKEMKSGHCRRSLEVSISLDISYNDQEEQFKLVATATSEDGRIAVKSVDAGNEKAFNSERMLGVFRSQLAKSSGHYDFYVEDISVHDDGKVPLMSASSINAIRRELASALDSSVCRSRRMYPQVTFQEGCPVSLDYSWNVSNAVAENMYRSRGASEIAPAYELAHPEGVCLMRSKYCIRHELGMCLKDSPEYKGPLFLRNNNRRLALQFDCRNCEMTVTAVQ